MAVFMNCYFSLYANLKLNRQNVFNNYKVMKSIIKVKVFVFGNQPNTDCNVNKVSNLYLIGHYVSIGLFSTEFFSFQ